MALADAVNSSHGLQYLKTNGVFPTISDGNLNDILIAQGNDVPPVWFDQNGIIAKTVKVDNIDLTVSGSFLIYAPPVGYNFITLMAAYYYTTKNGYISGAVVSLGYTSPTYTNYGSINYDTFNVGEYLIKTISTLVGPKSFITNSLPIFGNVSSPGVGTSLIGSIIVIGYLVPQ